MVGGPIQRAERRRAPTRGADNRDTPRAAAEYLKWLRPIVREGIESRRGFVREIGLVVNEARKGQDSLVAQMAGRVGRDTMPTFRELQARLLHQPPPERCQPCFDAVSTWLTSHVQACDVLVEVGASGTLRRLKEAHEFLAEGRRAAQRFNFAYHDLVLELRAIVAAAQRRRAERERRRQNRGRRRRPPVEVVEAEEN